MMTSISGERGVGKTLFLAERVYKKRMQGYFTITNFSHAYSNLDCSGLSAEEFLAVILNVIDFKDNGYEMFNIHPSFRHTGVYVAMDEATIYFSPEMQSKLAKSNPTEYSRLLNLLAQARKYDVEIDYVVQDPAKVGKDFRRYTEFYVRFRWLFKIKYLSFLPHPVLPIYRREHRHLIDVVWKETHDLDAENPKFNYSTINDENGISQYANTNTIIDRKLALTGKYKKKYLKMYNSYQPVAVRQREYSKEYSPLKMFKIMQKPIEDKIPTFKKLLRLIGIKMQIKGEDLPPKIGFDDIILPPKNENNKIISKVQSQETIIFSSDELKKQILRAYSENSRINLKKQMIQIPNAEPIYKGIPKPIFIEEDEKPIGRTKDIKKYVKKNSIKNPLPPTNSEDDTI